MKLVSNGLGMPSCEWLCSVTRILLWNSPKRKRNPCRSCLENELRRGSFVMSQDRAYQFAGVQIPEKSPTAPGIIPSESPALSGIDPRESPEGSGIFRGSRRLSPLDLGIESKMGFRATAAEGCESDPRIWGYGDVGMWVEALFACKLQGHRKDPLGEFPVNSLLFSSPASFPQHSSGFPNQKKNSLFFSLVNSLFRSGTGKKQRIQHTAC